MADFDPLATQRGLSPDLRAELGSVGFEDVEEIGHGGFGAVYRCRQVELDRMVAVKILTADLDAMNLERFLREQHAMGRLSGHPNITTIDETSPARTAAPKPSAVGTNCTGCTVHRPRGQSVVGAHRLRAVLQFVLWERLRSALIPRWSGPWRR
jgi:predicted amidohydrolase YtcJ